MTAELTLQYVHTDQIGYGRYGVALAENLQRIGVDVYDHLESPPDVASAEAPPVGARAKRTNVLAWVSVPGHARGWYRGQHTVMSTMWEASVLPETFRESLHEFDQIIVPSLHNVELFGRYHPNVTMVPLGVDPVRWQYRKRRPPRGEFRFLIGGSGARKGVDLAHEAFRRVFPKPPKDGPVPVLGMKSPRPGDYYGDRIEMVTGHIPAADEIDLYASAHCYLQPSRGEGFGLQPLQAIAQGLPTILTAAHGHESYAHLGYGISAKMSKAAYFMYGDAGEWWEPDFDELCEQMEYVYSNYDEACERAAEASTVALTEFSWEQTARRFVDAIGQDRLEAPYSGDGSWYQPTIKRYLVRVVRRWRADVGGATYQLEPNVDYWENADLKRVLFETGVLDPSCIGEPGSDGGLTDEEVARVGGYSAAHSYCHACGQKIGSGTTRVDEIMAELEESDGACV